MAAAASPLRDDYVADWLDEIRGVVDRAASFSPLARAALVAVIDSFEAEDGFLPRAGCLARIMLAPTPVEPGGTALSSPAEGPLFVLAVEDAKRRHLPPLPAPTPSQSCAQVATA